LPLLSVSSISSHDIRIGGAVLALPQLLLTLGNAVIAIREENNRLFPDRSVSEDAIATSTGLMNLISAVLGGIPMCHGAGGMAAHVAFGAKPGGAPIILGVVLLLLACFFSNSIEVVFSVFPQSLLGVILFLTGMQLSLGSCDFARTVYYTGDCCVFNVERGSSLGNRHDVGFYSPARLAAVIAVRYQSVEQVRR
jgi:MFS superfamily sulfate permease-like transporter